MIISKKRVTYIVVEVGGIRIVASAVLAHAGRGLRNVGEVVVRVDVTAAIHVVCACPGRTVRKVCGACRVSRTEQGVAEARPHPPSPVIG